MQASSDSLSLPNSQQAIPEISEFLLADPPQQHAVDSQPPAGPQAQAQSSASSAPASSPHPGPSHAAPVKWKVANFADEAFGAASGASKGSLRSPQREPLKACILGMQRLRCKGVPHLFLHNMTFLTWF